MKTVSDSMSTYSCRSCGARFGIVGESDGSDEDYPADEYYRSEVERHESGECVTPKRRRWLSLRRTPKRRRGVLLPVTAAAPKPKRATTAKQRHDSTRAKRARASRRVNRGAK